MSPFGSFLSSSRLPSLRQAVTLLNDTLEHRVDLASLELAEAGAHVRGSLVLLVSFVLLALFGGFATLLTCAAIVWDSPHREWWLAGLCLGLLGVAAGVGLALWRRLHSWQPFGEIRTQLQEDRACLNQLIKTNLP